MSSRQALIFEHMFAGYNPSAVKGTLEELGFSFRHDFLADYLKSRFENARPKPRTLRSAWSLLCRCLDVAGLATVHIDLGRRGEQDDYTSGPSPHSIYDDKLENDFEILVGLGLLKYTDTGYLVLNGRWDVKVMAYYVSTLGIEFARACGLGAKSIA
jgi:hypothetical protein